MKTLTSGRAAPESAADPQSQATTVGPGATRAAQRAAERSRRQANRAPGVAVAGRPVHAALFRIPFVIALIVVLGAGVGGVLYLNTIIDESGMRTEKANATTAQLRLDIEALDRSIADLRATPRIAQEARELGLVPAGDAAIMVLDDDGHGTLVGTPTPAKGGSTVTSEGADAGNDAAGAEGEGGE